MTLKEGQTLRFRATKGTFRVERINLAAKTVIVKEIKMGPRAVPIERLFSDILKIVR